MCPDNPEYLSDFNKPLIKIQVSNHGGYFERKLYSDG